MTHHPLPLVAIASLLVPAFSAAAEPVAVSGVDLGASVQVVGEIGFENDVIEYQDGADPVLRRRPGRTRVRPVTVEGALPIPADVQAWWDDARRGNTVRRTVQLQTPAGTAVLQGAFPSGLSIEPRLSRWRMRLAADDLELPGAAAVRGAPVRTPKDPRLERRRDPSPRKR